MAQRPKEPVYPAIVDFDTALQIAREKATQTGQHHALIPEGNAYLVRPVAAVASPDDAAMEVRQCG